MLSIQTFRKGKLFHDGINMENKFSGIFHSLLFFFIVSIWHVQVEQMEVVLPLFVRWWRNHIVAVLPCEISIGVFHTQNLLVLEVDRGWLSINPSGHYALATIEIVCHMVVSIIVISLLHPLYFFLHTLQRIEFSAQQRKPTRRPVPVAIRVAIDEI